MRHHLGLPMSAGVVILCEAPPPAPGERPDESLDRWEKRFLDASARLREQGSLWLFSRHGWDGGQLLPWPFLLAQRAAGAKLRLKSALVRHDDLPTPPGKPFACAHELVLLLVPSLARYHFDKTPLREPHVFKDLEWGGRSVGPTGYHPAARRSARYRPEGKDPGNVFTRARRDATGSVIRTDPYPREELATKLALASSAPGWTVLTDLDMDAPPERALERLRW